MHAYMARVEFFGDICKFMAWLEKHCRRAGATISEYVATCSVTRMQGSSFDMLWEFESTLDIHNLLKVMRQADRASGGVFDVMHETLQHAAGFDPHFRRWGDSPA